MNKLIEMFDMNKVKEAVKNCPKDEVVILATWPYDKPEYTKEEIAVDQDGEDWHEFEKEIGCPIMISDYNDLVADPHGIMND